MRKVGNSLGIILPATVLKDMGLNEGEELDLCLHPNNKQFIITKKEAPLYESEEFQKAVKDAVEKALQEREK
ncbi:AbrB/MazE/SpoVT family DNA-binding domain-containing protein [Priestia megaterium]|uniref:AbrB/MazE/SpoVT family DNA-binding domain-containing protein n=1 Tax=Priestia megaterium TaxID=1404 RepID=UPI002877FAEB|nr:AbrB/MazE/SpoVT family DNA-binding domain-containing protein [Priestia megaterium]